MDTKRKAVIKQEKAVIKQEILEDSDEENSQNNYDYPFIDIKSEVNVKDEPLSSGDEDTAEGQPFESMLEISENQALNDDVGQGSKLKRKRHERVESSQSIEVVEIVPTYNCLSPSSSWGGSIMQLNSPEVSVLTGTVDEDMQRNDDPWPYMSDYFKFKGKGSKEGNLLYECLQCLPQRKVISTSIKSRNNLKKHLESLHSRSLKNFETCIIEGSKAANRFKRKGPHFETQEDTLKRRKFLLHQSPSAETVSGLSTSQVVTPTIVEDKVMNVFVENVLPFDIVESLSFRSLLELLPGIHNLSTSSLKRLIEERFENEKNKLKVILQGLHFVSTTADAWTCGNKSYLGMTVHWIDCSTLKRKKAVLGCKRIKEPHKYDVIANTIQDIHCVFGIEKKVNKITTDKGSNFLKASSVFCGQEREVILENPDDEAHIEELTPILEEQPIEEAGFDLPEHFRCASHTLNLVATIDADKALEDVSYKEICLASFAKANMLWSKHHSSQALGIKEEVGELVTVPDMTRWDSIYDGVAHLVQVLENKDTLKKLRRTCTLLRIPFFNNSNMTFLREYQQVLRPVVKALDVLHREERAYMGVLLPTISICLDTLKDQRDKNEITLCQPLVKALINGLMKRFSNLFYDLDCLLSTALNPQFKLALWPNLLTKESFNAEEIKKKATNHLLTVLEKLIMEKHKVDNCGNVSEEEDYFQSLYDSGKKKEESGESVRNFLDATPHKKIDVNCFPSKELMTLFIKFNTPIPSSSAVERFFSAGKDILKPKWSGLSDEHFEMLVFLKGNPA